MSDKPLLAIWPEEDGGVYRVDGVWVSSGYLKEPPIFETTYWYRGGSLYTTVSLRICHERK